jgi:hypothetical protein
MKKIILFLLLALTVTKTIAQEGEDVGWVARFGAAGGLAPAFVFPNVDPINAHLKTMGIPELSKGIFVYGGGGYAYIMIVDNLRLGGIGFSGSQSTSGKLGPAYFNNDYEVNQNYSFGGLTVEYTLPFINKVALSLGAIIGLGTQSIDLYQNNGGYDWNTIWPQPVYSSLMENQVLIRKLKIILSHSLQR